MPLPVPNLDDRRFEDLVTEARNRLGNHLPELTHVPPGDPVHGFIDLFAWLTETILYRANLIPERQRRVFLNILQIPVRPARPARGVVCIDAGEYTLHLPAVTAAGSAVSGSGARFTTLGEVQATPLSLAVTAKEAVDPASLPEMGLDLPALAEQYGIPPGDQPTPFRPRHLQPAREGLSLAGALDGDKGYYLAFITPQPLAERREALREALAGITLNIALAPADDQPGDTVEDLRPRALRWELLSKDEDGELVRLPLEVAEDSSRGGRRPGVARVRVPRNADLFEDFATEDPMFLGVGNLPPALPDDLPSERVTFWLRLSCPEEPSLPLGYLGVNGVEVVGQGLAEDVMLGAGTGQPDQVVTLPDRDVAPDSLVLQVEEEGRWVTWHRVDFLAGHGGDARVYRLDAAAGHVHFGNGLQGRRPPRGRRIRAESYRFGGGRAGNLPPGALTELDGSSRLSVRQEHPTTGGVDAETVEEAERRIPQFLTHRNRAVTLQDFRALALTNPVNAVARAEVKAGFIPGSSIRAVRRDVPGAVSVFVLPPAEPALGNTPRATQGLLKDVFGYLLERVLVGTELYVLSPEPVPLAVSTTVTVRDPSTEQETLRAVRESLVRYLWPLPPGGFEEAGWPLGGDVRDTELLTRVARVPGVRAVNDLALFRRDGSAWSRIPAGQALDLDDYQLPDLRAVEAGSGTGEAPQPRGTGPGDGGEGNVPAPVIPDVC